jgi:Holliday junction resolvasome RuvABC endonuclease subunit
MQIILGLDQGTKKCGFSIFTDGVLSSFGVFLAPEKFLIEQRTIIIYEQIKKVIIKYGITQVVFEETTLQGANNAKLLRDLARLQGTIMVLCHENKIKYTVLYPSTWRSLLGFLSGKSKEDTKREKMKECAIAHVNLKYNMKLKKTDDDVAEGICIGEAFLLSSKNK